MTLIMTRTYVCNYVHTYICTYVHAYVPAKYLPANVSCYVRTYVHTYKPTHRTFVFFALDPWRVSLLPPFVLLCFCTGEVPSPVSCVLCQGWRCRSSLCCHVRTSLFLHSRQSTLSYVLCQGCHAGASLRNFSIPQTWRRV
jgi:hypothetical protein